ncbi:Aste57867_179 [Aphanomyces stellatus]|uniref:Aste57867_179 protein n=1 Tax=Aphanomyces stellatus TaxID=120398 RepID=A0A485K261_9STRA|nr:hypothetical protein As57867_000179 [Aphanomyces stellatus]VFT77405.1 Aste57867_179 [Aphanomyces stellatus]
MRRAPWPAQETDTSKDTMGRKFAASEIEESSVWSSDVEPDKSEDTPPSEDKKTRRRAQIAKSARKHRIRQKAELQNLRIQVQELTDALAKSRGNVPHPSGDQHEDPDEFGSQASLRGLWLNAPLQTDTGPGPNVYHQFHHIPVEPSERMAKLLAIAKPGPVRMYTQIVEDTQGVPSFPPYVDVRMTSLGDNVSIKFCRVCEITSFDHKTVSEVFSNIFWGFDTNGVVNISGLCRRKLLASLDTVSHYEHVSYVVPNMPEVRLESLDVVTRLSLPNYTIFTWESIDQDDLFPPSMDHHTIRREEIGSVMFRTETDPDGNIRTVLRTVIYSRPFVRALPKIFGDMNEPFAHLYCRLNVMAEEQVSRHLLQKFMTR